MSNLLFHRINDVIELGTYGSSSTGIVGLRTIPDSLDAFNLPVAIVLARGNSGWQKESSGHYHTTLSYDMNFFIREATGNPKSDEIGIADANNLELLTAQIFLSRPHLQLAGKTPLILDEIVGEISLQTTSNLASPILFPFGLSVSQGAKPYWGWVMRLSIETRYYVQYLPQG